MGGGERVPLGPWVLSQWLGLGSTKDLFIHLLGEEAMENDFDRGRIVFLLHPQPHLLIPTPILKTQTLSLGDLSHT